MRFSYWRNQRDGESFGVLLTEIWRLLREVEEWGDRLRAENIDPDILEAICPFDASDGEEQGQPTIVIAFEERLGPDGPRVWAIVLEIVRDNYDGAIGDLATRRA